MRLDAFDCFHSNVFLDLYNPKLQIADWSAFVTTAPNCYNNIESATPRNFGLYPANNQHFSTNYEHLQDVN